MSHKPIFLDLKRVGYGADTSLVRAHRHAAAAMGAGVARLWLQLLRRVVAHGVTCVKRNAQERLDACAAAWGGCNAADK